jgi:hypothetical protein
LAKVYLNSALSGLVDFTTLNTDGTNLHALYLSGHFDADVLQVRQPASFVVRVVVRTQKRVVAPGLGNFPTGFTYSCHGLVPILMTRKCPKLVYGLHPTTSWKCPRQVCFESKADFFSEEKSTRGSLFPLRMKLYHEHSTRPKDRLMLYLMSLTTRFSGCQLIDEGQFVVFLSRIITTLTQLDRR